MAEIQKLKFRLENGWTLIEVPERVDSQAHLAFADGVQDLQAQGNLKLAMDLSQSKFLSLPTIKYLVQKAQELSGQGGRLALVSAPERLKRQFSVYGSLEPINVVRRAADLQA